MAWDTTATAVAIKAIGTVESSMRYDAINFNDPITLGIGQWFGTRAANILFRIRDENPSTWTGVHQGILDSMAAHAASATWWNGRNLTHPEGNSLKPVLKANQAIQDDQMAQDLEEYKDRAKASGLDIDANPKGSILWMVGYHQSPQRAMRLLSAVGNADLNRMLAAFLNEPVFGRYKTRYNTAAQIISAWDPSGVIVTPPDTPDDPEVATDDAVPSDPAQPKGDIVYIEQSTGSHDLIIHFRDGHTQQAIRRQTGQHWFVQSVDPNNGTPLPPAEPPGGQPATPPTAAQDQQRADVAQFMRDHVGKYVYSQGAGRKDPDGSGVTDCSGMVGFAYRAVLGKDIGNSSRDQCSIAGPQEIYEGTGDLPIANMLPGDLIFYSHGGTRRSVDVFHVEMYVGNGERCGQKEPRGPKISPANNGKTGYRWVRRWIY